MNTPDTEVDAYSRGYKQGRFDSEMDRLNEEKPTPDTEWETPDEFAQKLYEKVRYFSGKGQYEENSDEQKAYIDGVETAIGMMYIYLTSTPKTKGMLSSRDTYWKERVRKEVRDAYEHAEIVRQRTLNEIRQAVEDDEPYGGAKECIYAILDRYQPDVEIVQNQETGEIITANGVPLTPTPLPMKII